jgi:hypothetical protein
MTEEEHAALHDITCCWLWIRENMLTAFPGELVTKHDALFLEG